MSDDLQDRFDFDGKLRREYQVWRQTSAGQTGYALCRRFALEKLARRQRFGIAQLVERVRWDVPVAIEKDDAGFRLNNNHRAYIARELIEEIPELANLIETRKVSDVRVCRDARKAASKAIA
jgi:hypothetical protein